MDGFLLDSAKDASMEEDAMRSARRHLFLQGDVDVGKTTLIHDFCRRRESEGVQVLRFQTTTVKKDGKIEGYYLEDNRNGKAMLHPIGKSRLEDGKRWWYGVPETFETVGVELMEEILQARPPLVVLDELGFFEVDAPG